MRNEKIPPHVIGTRGDDAEKKNMTKKNPNVLNCSTSSITER